MFSLACLARGVGMTFIISPGFLVAASVPDLPLTATDELLHAIRAGPATTKILGKSSTATLESIYMYIALSVQLEDDLTTVLHVSRRLLHVVQISCLMWSGAEGVSRETTDQWTYPHHCGCAPDGEKTRQYRAVCGLVDRSRIEIR